MDIGTKHIYWFISMKPASFFVSLLFDAMGNTSSVGSPVRNEVNQQRLHAPLVQTEKQKVRHHTKEDRRIKPDFIKGQKVVQSIGEDVLKTIVSAYGDAIILILLEKESTVKAKLGFVQNVVVQYVKATTTDNDVIHIGQLVLYLFEQETRVNVVWLLVILLWFEHIRDIPEQVMKELRKHVLWHFSTANTGQAAVYAFFVPMSVKNLNKTAGNPIKSHVVMDMLFRENLLPSDGSSIMSFLSNWSWRSKVHPLAMHMEVMTMLMSTAGWNSIGSGSYLSLIQASNDLNGELVALEGFGKLQLGNMMWSDDLSKVFQLNYVHDDSTDNRFAANNTIATKSFVLKVGKWWDRREIVYQAVMGTKAALACSWLSFMANTNNLCLTFAEEAILDTEPPVQIYRFALLLDDVGTVTFEDIPIEAFSSVVTQTYLAMGAFHRYAKCLHGELSAENVMLNSGMAFSESTGVETLRYLVSRGDGESDQLTHITSLSLFNVGEPVEVEALEKVMVIGIPVQETYFASVVDWDNSAKLSTAQENSSKRLVHALVDNLTAEVDTTIPPFTPMSVDQTSESQNMIKSLRVIFDDVRQTFPSPNPFDPLAVFEGSLNVFENEVALEGLIDALESNRDEHDRLLNGGPMYNYMNSRSLDGGLREVAHLRVLQGFVMERTFLGVLSHEFVGMDTVCRDFVIFTLSAIRKLRINVAAKSKKATTAEDSDEVIFKGDVMLIQLFAALGSCFALSVVPLMKAFLLTVNWITSDTDPIVAFTDDGLLKDGKKLSKPDDKVLFRVSQTVQTGVVKHMTKFNWKAEVNMLRFAIGFLTGSMPIEQTLGEMANSAIKDDKVLVVNMTVSSEEGFSMVTSAVDDMPTYRMTGKINNDRPRKRQKRNNLGCEMQYTHSALDGELADVLAKLTM